MKVVNILGSPRKNGNSATVARTVCARLENDGATVVTHYLNGLLYKGCQGCEACKKGSEKCIVDDDLAAVLEDITGADVVVVSTPVYWGEVTAQLKACIDRFYSFLKPGFMQGNDMHRLPAGKQFVYIQTQGAPEPSQFSDIYSRYNSFFEQLQFFAAAYRLQGCGLSDRSDAAADAKLMKAAEQVAMKVLEKAKTLSRKVG